LYKQTAKGECPAPSNNRILVAKGTTTPDKQNPRLGVELQANSLLSQNPIGCRNRYRNSYYSTPIANSEDTTTGSGVAFWG